MLNPGIKGSASVAVTAANTAAAMGSGELNVFATPALAALVEKACWQSVAPELDPGCGTVGTKLELAHNAPTPVGMMVRCESELTAVDGRKLTFSAVMYDDAGEVGRAEAMALPRQLLHRRCFQQVQQCAAFSRPRPSACGLSLIHISAPTRPY